MAKNKNKKVEEVLEEVEEVSVDKEETVEANEAPVVEESVVEEVAEVKAPVVEEVVAPKVEVKPSLADKPIKSTSPLNNPALSDENKLKALLKENNSLSAIASVLVSYAKATDGNVDGNTMADKNFNIYTAIKRVASLEYPAFKEQFDVVNLAFRVYSKGTLSQFKLVRGDVELRSKRGVSVHKTYKALMTLIAILCNPITRAEKLRTAVSLPKYLMDFEDLSEQARLNIQKYYSF